MTEDAFPTVMVWAKLTGSTWGWVGTVATYTSLEYEPHLNEAGTFDMTMPWELEGQSKPVLTDRLYTIDWRGYRTTWALDTWNPKQDEKGQETLQVGGPSALSIIGREVAWPDPSRSVQNQPGEPDTPPLISGSAEAVVRQLVLINYMARNSGEMVLASSLDRGDPVRSRSRWDNLLDLIGRKGGAGNIGFDVNLVNTSDTRAELTFQVYEPVDRSARVSLSQDLGTVSEWSQNNTAPTATKAIVGGAGGGTSRIYAIVTTPESEAAALAWGGHRVVFVNGPSSYDAADLQQAGIEELKNGAATTNVALTGTDSAGLSAFTHYNVGDKVTGQLVTGLDAIDVITSIKVEVGDGPPKITATFGDPSADDPVVSMAQLVRNQDRRIRKLEQGS